MFFLKAYCKILYPSAYTRFIHHMKSRSTINVIMLKSGSVFDKSHDAGQVT